MWIRQNRRKAVTPYSEKSFFWNHSLKSQVVSSSNQLTQPLLYFLTNTCIRSKFSAQLLTNLNNFSFRRKRCATKKNKKSLLMVLKSLQIILICVPKMVLYQIVVRISKVLFLSMTLCISIMTRTRDFVDFDCGITFYPETPAKSDKSTENGIIFPDLVKNPSAFPATINTTVLLMNCIPLISSWARTDY